MTDEEKKEFKCLKEKIEMNKLYGIDIYLNKEQVKIIENLFKEIEELKENMRKRIIYCNELEKDLFENCSNYVVSKDKIKTIIEELQEDIKYSANPLSIDNSKIGIKVLQSLLEKE